MVLCFLCSYRSPKSIGMIQTSIKNGKKVIKYDIKGSKKLELIHSMKREKATPRPVRDEWFSGFYSVRLPFLFLAPDASVLTAQEVIAKILNLFFFYFAVIGMNDLLSVIYY